MKIFGDNVLSLYICTQTIKGFYVYLLSSFYIGVRSFVKSTGSSFFSSALCLFPKDSPDLRQVIMDQVQTPVLWFVIKFIPLPNKGIYHVTLVV